MRNCKRPLALLLTLVMLLGGFMLSSPEAAAEEEAVPYAEEMGLEFTEDTVLHAPFFSYLEKNGEYVPSVEGLTFTSMGDMEYSIDSVSLSEPDEEGLVTLDILVTATGSSLWEAEAGESFDLNCRQSATGLSFFDYYSGCVPPFRDLMDSDSTESSVEFLIDGESVPVSGVISSEASSRWRFGSWSKYDTWQNELLWEYSFKYSATYPAGYDGLCLALYKPGKTEYKELDTEELPESKPLLGEDGTGAENYYCLRVTELLAAFGS